MSAPRVSAVVVSFNTRDDLLCCLGSLRGASLPLETVVVDNASDDGSAEAVAAGFPEVRLIRSPENVGFSRANNLGIRETRAPYVLVLNSDAEVHGGALEALAAVLDARPDVGIVGPRTLGSDGSVQVSFGPELTPLAEWRQRRLVRGVRARSPAALRESAARASAEREAAWVSASCLLARRAALDAVSGFDEGFFLYEEDVDLCVRVRAAGFRILFTPRAEVVHHLGRSMSKAPERSRLEYHRSHLRYYRKHNGPAARAFLRAYLAVLGGWTWLAGAAAGPGGAARRGLGRALVGLGLQGG